MLFFFSSKHSKTPAAVSSERGVLLSCRNRGPEPPATKHVRFPECFSLRSGAGKRTEMMLQKKKKAQPSRRKRQR